MSRLNPLGTFRAVSTRDASAQERDGQIVYELNLLNADARDGHLYEVRFGDGIWMLAADLDLVPAFGLASLPGVAWPAFGYGTPWNGWATPVVTRDTLGDLLVATEESHVWDGDAATVADDRSALKPDATGHYDLSFLGWTFVQVRFTSGAGAPG